MAPPHRRPLRTALVLLALGAALCPASWLDGKLEEGERYDAVKYSPRAYRVYQFPYGIDWAQTGSNGTLRSFLLRHTPCPQGNDCKTAAAELVAVGVDMATLTVRHKVKVQAPADWTVDASGGLTAPSGDSYLAAVVARSLQTPDALVAVIDGATGAVVYDAQQSATPIVAMNPRTKRVHVLQQDESQPGSPGSVRIYDERMRLVNSADIRPTVPTAARVYMERQEVFAGTRNASGYVELVRYMEAEGPISMEPIPLPGHVPIVGLLVREDVGELYVFRQDTEALDPSNMSRTAYLDVNRYSIVNGSFVSLGGGSVADTWLYTGSFFLNGYLYTYNVAGQIIRLDANIVGFPVIRSLCTHSGPCYGERGALPYLYVAGVDSGANAVWFGANWWGNLIRVDLAQLCSDIQCTSSTPPPSPPPGGSLWGLAIVLPLVIVATALAIIGRRKGWWQRFNSRRRNYEEVGGKSGLSSSNAVGDSHL